MADQFDLAALALLPDTVKRKILRSVGTSSADAPQQQVPQQPLHVHEHAGTAAVAGEVVSAVRRRAVQLPALGTARACVVDNVLSASEAQVMWAAAACAAELPVRPQNSSLFT
jgi:hypothetical protein